MSVGFISTFNVLRVAKNLFEIDDRNLQVSEKLFFIFIFGKIILKIYVRAKHIKY